MSVEMPTYAYNARDRAGAAVAGTLVADSVAEVTRLLRADGRYPTAIKPAEAATPARAAVVRRRGVKVPRAEVIQVATQLAVMIDTGVTLSDALDCVAGQAERPNSKALLNDLCEQVRSGGDFSSAVGRHPRSFPPVFVALIKASERSGTMAKLLTRATVYLRDEQETIRKVRGAITYPLVMLAFAVATTVFLLAAVLPKFTAIYAAKGAALPTPTRVLMAVSSFVTGHPVALPTGVAAVAVGVAMGLRTEPGTRAWHWLQLRLPLVGPLFRKLHLSRGLRTVGTMAGSGVGLVDCVQIVRGLTGNVYFRQLWDTVAEQIQMGRQLSDPLLASPLVPRPVARMIGSGERSGKLAVVLEQIAAYGEQELKEQIADVTRYVEPLMIAILGSVIGGVTIALLLPIFTISRVVAR